MRVWALAVAVSISASAMSFDLPVKTINGQKVFYYTVGVHETTLSIAKALGVNVTQIYLYNRSASDGVKKGQVLYFPYEEFKNHFNELSSVDRERMNASVQGQKIHVVKEGETLFGISKTYGVPVDRLVKLNPSVSTGGVKAGQKLLIAEVSAADNAVAENNNGKASDNGSEAENNTSDSKSKDKTTRGKKSGKMTAQKESHQEKNSPETVPAVPEQTNELTPVNPEVAVSDGNVADGEAEIKSDMSPVKIVMVMPFELSEEKVSKQAQLNTDFMRGALLGANEMSIISDKVDIKVIDTGMSEDGDISHILNDTVLSKANFIIGPSSPSQFARIARYGASHGIYVINPFIVKDTTYIDNPYVVQLYIDTDRMYQKAADEVMYRISEGYTPVFLHNTAHQSDKESFLEILKGKFAAGGVTPLVINYDGNLVGQDLADALNDAGKYIFLPESGTLAEFNKFCIPMVKFFGENFANAGGQGILFGYPEWAAFQGRAAENLAKLNAVYFSRFNVRGGMSRYDEIKDSFNEWYGRSMIVGFPIQALHGYDLMEYLLATIKTTGVNLKEARQYEGVQAAYNFTVDDGAAGMSNDALYFISLQPDESVNVIVK